MGQLRRQAVPPAQSDRGMLGLSLLRPPLAPTFAPRTGLSALQKAGVSLLELRAQSRAIKGTVSWNSAQIQGSSKAAEKREAPGGFLRPLPSEILA